MPKEADALTRARQAGASALALINAAVAKAEAELEDLREHARMWREAISGRVAALKVRAPQGRRAAATQRSERVDWAEVLASLPRQFSMPDVMKHRGAAARGKPQAYVAIARWESMGRVKRLAPGQYRKVLRASSGAGAKNVTKTHGRKRSAGKKRTIAKKRPSAATKKIRKRALALRRPITRKASTATKKVSAKKRGTRAKAAVRPRRRSAKSSKPTPQPAAINAPAVEQAAEKIAL